MGKTYKESKDKRNKPPRGPYRQKWDMPHKNKNDYNRLDEKQEIEQQLIEEDEDVRELHY
jgi:hypothetical protein